MNTPAERRLRAQIAANTRWAHEDPAANAARGQAGLTARFEREVDPDGSLSSAERARRVARVRRAHMQKLALASAKARRRPADGRDGCTDADSPDSGHMSAVST